MRLGLSHRFVEAEQNAAGWPSWLTSVAGEAIHGWVPLKTDSFEKLDKVQHTPIFSPSIICMEWIHLSLFSALQSLFSIMFS